MRSRALELLTAQRADLPADAIAALRVDVRAHYDALLRDQRHSELVAVDLAEQLCHRLEALLDACAALPARHRAAVVGAARYFISDDDAVPDHHALTGLDDDVFVFNTVARELGRLDLLIDG